MAMSKNYLKVKRYYDKGLWDKERVSAAVGKWITADEYEKITGEKYEQGRAQRLCEATDW
ncbi:MAG: XkdX family protein [Clostridiales bacterium]|nr:XkdX family protein [Clostridiales bacterium]